MLERTQSPQSSPPGLNPHLCTIGAIWFDFQTPAYSNETVAGNIMLIWKNSKRSWWPKLAGAWTRIPPGQEPGEKQSWRSFCIQPPRIWPLVAVGLSLLLTNTGYNRAATIAPPRLEDMPKLSLVVARRVLVIAPHPDDETLAAGGTVQSLLAQGTQVKVLFMTNGDGQAIAPLVLRREFRPRSANYILTGQQRQAEALEALKVLGVQPKDVYFLGYPDRGLNLLWAGDWTEECPLRATYTRTTSSPYALTFNTRARYWGGDVLADLRAILADYRPDLILVPHAHDKHRDHSATSNFVQLALALESAEWPDYRPELWAYLVHYAAYPQQRSLYPTGTLLPPLPLLKAGCEWARLDLSWDQVEIKARALAAHVTQKRLLGSFLQRFIRRNELFVRVPVTIEECYSAALALDQPGLAAAKWAGRRPG